MQEKKLYSVEISIQSAVASVMKIFHRWDIFALSGFEVINLTNGAAKDHGEDHAKDLNDKNHDPNTQGNWHVAQEEFYQLVSATLTK